MRESKALMDPDRIIIAANPRINSILKDLFAEAKKNKEQMSLEFLARKIGLKSKNNLSDMFQGRRKVPRKYLGSLLDVFKVDGLSKAYMLMLYEYEVNKTKTSQSRRDLNVLRKAIRINLVHSSLKISPFAFKVFCALGMVDLQEKKNFLAEKIASFYNESWQEVISALQELEDVGVLKAASKGYQIVLSDVLFKDDHQNDTGKELAKNFILEALESLDTKYKSKESLYFSNMISVNKDNYFSELENLKNYCKVFTAKVEQDENAENVVLFNVQAVPLKDFD